MPKLWVSLKIPKHWGRTRNCLDWVDLWAGSFCCYEEKSHWHQWILCWSQMHVAWSAPTAPWDLSIDTAMISRRFPPAPQMAQPQVCNPAGRMVLRAWKLRESISVCSSLQLVIWAEWDGWRGHGRMCLVTAGGFVFTSLYLHRWVWLPKKTLEDVLTLRRLHLAIIGLARMGQKYGVRANPSLGGLARITSHNLPKLVSNHGDRKVEALPNGLNFS